MPGREFSVIHRVHRQHNCLVVVIPKLVREKLALKVGDYVEFHWLCKGKHVGIKRVKTGAI